MLGKYCLEITVHFRFTIKRYLREESKIITETIINRKQKKVAALSIIFKVKGFGADSKEYVKAIKKGGKGRIILETDVENDFLTRSSDNGSIEITTLDY